MLDCYDVEVFEGARRAIDKNDSLFIDTSVVAQIYLPPK